MRSKPLLLICLLSFGIYGILYLFKIKVGLLLLMPIIIPMICATILAPILIVLYLVTLLYNLFNAVFRRKLAKKSEKDFYRKVIESTQKSVVGTLVTSLIVLFVLIGSFVELGWMYQRLYYYRCKGVLAEVPFNFPENITSTNGEAFIEAIFNYEDPEQRCFYFDLQWSIRHSKSKEEKERFQALETRFLQLESAWHPQQILAYNLHEALLADSRDSILHYFKELHPGNIYNTRAHFTRISKTRKLITATEGQEYNMACGINPGAGARRYFFSPRPLTQAIVNSTCFSKDEKTKMVAYIVRCFMGLAKYNNCPENYIRDFNSKIFVESNSEYHISHIKSTWAGSSYIEDKINELMRQMRESNESWIGIYTPENWTQFSF